MERVKSEAGGSERGTSAFMHDLDMCTHGAGVVDVSMCGSVNRWQMRVYANAYVGRTARRHRSIVGPSVGSGSGQVEWKLQSPIGRCMHACVHSIFAVCVCARPIISARIQIYVNVY